MRIFIQRNGNEFGPYAVSAIQDYLANGSLLPHDLAKTEGGANYLPLAEVLTKAGVKPAEPRVKNPLQQVVSDLRSLNRGLLFPARRIASFEWLKNRTLLYFAAVGLLPAVALAASPEQHVAYWGIALYFSGLWVSFFYALFKTPQVKPWLAPVCFFFTGLISVTVLLALQSLEPWKYFYKMANSEWFLERLIGMIGGVGVNEELCKAAIVFVLVRRAGGLLMPQTVVFYGMISGLGFGVYEGVSYQLTVNKEMGIDAAYFMNVVRLTSLPFLHAVWTGIGAYFIGFAALYPRRRYGLWVAAISIPASLHGLYNIFGWSLVGLGISFLSVIILMVYLSQCVEFQQSLQLK
jgi:RsiW-degrading membrane proteinase PrsW (M82 family)